MSREQLQAVHDRVKAAKDLDGQLVHDAAEAVRSIFPTAPYHPEALSDPTEAVLHTVDHCLPGWAIRLQGRATEPDGHWRCYLRKSESRDDDAVIGIGAAPTVGLAMLDAIVQIALIQARD